MSGDGRLMNLILSPVISEKSTDLAEKRRTAVFYVLPDARKDEIRRAVEKMFQVKVEAVRVARTRGKVVQRLGRWGRRASSKKAFVRLAEGNDINFAELQ
ncbi:MAG: 50S ribosomal protein L23 [Gammaproteobacteria bacterium]